MGCFALPKEFGDRKCLQARTHVSPHRGSLDHYSGRETEEQKLPVRGVLGWVFVSPTEAWNVKSG